MHGSHLARTDAMSEDDALFSGTGSLAARNDLAEGHTTSVWQLFVGTALLTAFIFKTEGGLNCTGSRSIPSGDHESAGQKLDLPVRVIEEQKFRSEDLDKPFIQKGRPFGHCGHGRPDLVGSSPPYARRL